MRDAEHATRIMLLHGPNLNLLGERDSEHYGNQTLKELEDEVAAYARNHGFDLVCLQNNCEGALIDAIHDARLDCVGIVFNPGAYTHYSYALHDAIDAIAIPVVEVHQSNIMEREEFRRVSVIAPACEAQVYGKGIEGYFEAIDIIKLRLSGGSPA